jgi:hypothetical protein
MHRSSRLKANTSSGIVTRGLAFCLAWTSTRVLALGVPLLLACDLVAPTRLETYDLITVNGASLPYIFTHSRGVDGKLFEEVVTNGSVTLFSGGRFSWNWTMVASVDGQAIIRDGPAPFTGQLARHGTNISFADVLSGEEASDGQSLEVVDQTGQFNWARYRFLRRR